MTNAIRFEQLHLPGTGFLVSGYYYPGEKETRHEPGEPPSVEILAVDIYDSDSAASTLSRLLPVRRLIEEAMRKEAARNDDT